MYYCSKCGDPIEQNEMYCNKCGNYIGNTVNNNLNNTPSNNYQFNNQNPLPHRNKIDSETKKMIIIGSSSGLGILLLVFVCLFIINRSNEKYYFSSNDYENAGEIVQNTNNSEYNKKTGKYSTVIITDNTYSGVKIGNINDAYELIVKDSVNQKESCSAETKNIENEMIENYNITAINLCEMDAGFAKELGNVFKKIYDEYPSVRGYITNLSLVNVSLADGNIIAAFMPIFNFATSDSSSTYPWIIKTQVLLNTRYFLNPNMLELSVKDCSNTGHFPPNSTIYSPVAHELGHYLSFLAMMKHYQMNSILLIDNKNVDTLYKLQSDFGKGDYSLIMITKAYENYKKDTNTTLSIDDWRATISNYAVNKDNSGNYIYDETIAEAFHDVYLNGENAKDASKYVVSVLKKKLGEA